MVVVEREVGRAAADWEAVRAAEAMEGEKEVGARGAAMVVVEREVGRVVADWAGGPVEEPRVEEVARDQWPELR